MKRMTNAMCLLLSLPLLTGCANNCKPVTETVYLRQEVPPAFLQCAPVPVADVVTCGDVARFAVDLGDAYGQTCANLKAVAGVLK